MINLTKVICTHNLSTTSWREAVHHTDKQFIWCYEHCTTSIAKQYSDCDQEAQDAEEDKALQPHAPDAQEAEGDSWQETHKQENSPQGEDEGVVTRKQSRNYGISLGDK